MRICPQGKGRASVVWRIPLLVVHKSIYSALAMAEMFCMHVCTWRKLEHPPLSSSVTLKKKKMGIKERKKYVVHVHKIEITYPEIQRSSPGDLKARHLLEILKKPQNLKHVDLKLN